MAESMNAPASHPDETPGLPFLVAGVGVGRGLEAYIDLLAELPDRPVWQLWS